MSKTFSGTCWRVIKFRIELNLNSHEKFTAYSATQIYMAYSCVFFITTRYGLDGNLIQALNIKNLKLWASDSDCGHNWGQSTLHEGFIKISIYLAVSTPLAFFPRYIQAPLPFFSFVSYFITSSTPYFSDEFRLFLCSSQLYSFHVCFLLLLFRPIQYYYIKIYFILKIQKHQTLNPYHNHTDLQFAFFNNGKF